MSNEPQVICTTILCKDLVFLFKTEARLEKWPPEGHAVQVAEVGSRVIRWAPRPTDKKNGATQGTMAEVI